jgi:hypothetical protein
MTQGQRAIVAALVNWSKWTSSAVRDGTNGAGVPLPRAGKGRAGKEAAKFYCLSIGSTFQDASPSGRYGIARMGGNLSPTKMTGMSVRILENSGMW